MTVGALVDPQVAGLIARALAEDLGAGDITTEAIVGPERRAVAQIRAKAPGVLAGMTVAEAVFLAADATAGFHAERADGTRLSPGDLVAVIRGSARGLLAAERTALNFLQHLSGIATATALAVRLLEGTGVCLLDTRKTTPGLRSLEKGAVAVGGGVNHRSGLWDHYLLKENHLELAGGVGAAVSRVRRHAGGHTERGVEVEVRSQGDLDAALEAGVDRVMLDNFDPDGARAAVSRVAGRCEVEISGGVTLDNLGAYAAARPDFISLGWLTHSAPALDLSMTLQV